MPEVPMGQLIKVAWLEAMCQQSSSFMIELNVRSENNNDRSVLFHTFLVNTNTANC
jgi:hypothetical protein